MKKNLRLFTSAFTLIEMLVVVAIVLLITLLILFNTNKFNSSILLKSAGYEVATALREAQIYGVGVKEVTPGSANFAGSYGIHIVASASPSNNKSFVLFADANANGKYDSGEPVIETFTLRNGIYIGDFCAVTAGGIKHCASDVSSPVTFLDIVFTRPNPDASITDDVGPTNRQASISLASGSDTHTVTVTLTGQIGVQ